MDATNDTLKNSPQQGNGRKRRWPMVAGDVRFFLAKEGSSPERPELGEEVSTEKEALVRAFQRRQVFFTVVTWDAVPDTEGDQARIVKRALKRD